MDYFVQCGTTAILNRNLPRLADELRGELRDTGYVLEPEVISNLLFGLLESDGWVSREQTGAIRVGFATTSEQMAHQIRVRVGRSI